jgi:hypothetical protein
LAEYPALEIEFRWPRDPTLPEERIDAAADGAEKPFFEKVKDIFG